MFSGSLYLHAGIHDPESLVRSRDEFSGGRDWQLKSVMEYLHDLSISLAFHLARGPGVTLAEGRVRP